MKVFKILSALLFVIQPLVAETPLLTPPNASKTNQSEEASVIEQFSCKEKFENDGTYTREHTARVKIQSDAGVQQYGVLTFSYASGTGSYEIAYVRVHKPDGSVVETPSDNVQDMTSEITRQAPIYSDMHEKHVAVKGLGVGDILEYKTMEHGTKPLVPGQFWSHYKFIHEQIVLDEQFEVSAPRDRPLKIKSETIQPVITEVGGYRVYTWHSKNLEPKDNSKQKREKVEQMWRQTRGRLPQPDVRVSSFASWEEVGRWYGGLQEERIKPMPEVTAKAVELTKNAANEEEKIRAIYSYVSTQFHYVGVSFGIGRYQPHSAAEVLANQYGDCKDKHTLLASMLSAVGIPAYPALIGSGTEVDNDVPSPGQFDHVITVVPRDGGMVWLDATAEVGPYRYLLASLRDKQALVISKGKAVLVKTPEDLPYETMQKFHMDAKLNDTGTLEGKVEFSARGDIEYALRRGFRMVPLPQWKDFVQGFSIGLGFGGEVSDVRASSPENTEEPFHFSYKYTRKEFGDWADRQIVAPTPLIALVTDDEDSLPLGTTWLGPASDILFTSEMELPSGYRPVIAEAIHWKRDFAQFDAHYSFNNGKLETERHLKTAMREAPASERDAYKQLVKTVRDDYSAFIPLLPVTEPSTAQLEKVKTSKSILAIKNLPDSSNEDANRLEREAHEALDKHDGPTAVSALYRSVGADPKFTRAWVTLGRCLLAEKQKDAGIEAFQRAISADPGEPAIPKVFAWNLMAISDCNDAIPVWQNFEKTNPGDVDGPSNLGVCLMEQKRYSEAIAAFERTIKVGGDRFDEEKRLGSAYLQSGEKEKAAAAFAKSAELDKEGIFLNDMAYEMANVDLNLPVALDYSKRAVHKVEEDSQKVTMANLTVNDLRQILMLSSLWDTRGWVAEHMNQLDAAERYLQASWRLTQFGIVASHLCHVYELQHKTGSAIAMCRMAASRLGLSKQPALQPELDDVKARLNLLMGGPGKTKNLEDPSVMIMHEREFKLPRFLPGSESAEFFVLFESDATSKTFRVEDVKFITGSEKMKFQGKQLKTIDFKMPAPSDTPARFVKRGILGCYEYSGCSFVLLDPVSGYMLD